MKSPVIGVTGGIACGKSEVGRILRSRGVEVLDADEVAHDLMRKGRPVYDEVVRRFGAGFLDADGRIDRAALGRRVFADEAERDALNAIVHPAVRAEWRAWVAERRRLGRAAAVIIPLLFEVGETAAWDAIVCIASDEENVLRRLAERGLSRSEARRRLASQWPLERKCAAADYVIDNNGTLDDLERSAGRVLETILQKERQHHG